MHVPKIAERRQVLACHALNSRPSFRLAGNEVIGGNGVSGAPGGPLDAACVETAFKKVQARLN